jgi:hypothetical protein
LGFSLPQQPEIRRPHRYGHQLRQLFEGRNGEGTEMPKAALKCRNRHLSAAYWQISEKIGGERLQIRARSS